MSPDTFAPCFGQDVAVNSLPMKKSYLLLLALAWIASPDAVQAQDSTYTPPPMFDDPTPPMVRPETTTGNIVEPKKSTREPAVDYKPVQPAVPPIAPVVPQPPAYVAPAQPLEEQPLPSMMIPILEGDPATTKAPSATQPAKPVVKAPTKPAMVRKKDKPTPPPPVKPVPPVKAAQKKEPAAIVPDAVLAPLPTPAPEPVTVSPAETPVVPASVVNAPIVVDAPKPVAPIAIEPQKPITQPAAKITNKGVVTGPKTMPAVPTKSVEEEETFLDLTAPIRPEKTILELHQERMEAEKNKDKKKKDKSSDTLTPLVPASAESAQPFDDSKQGALKKILPYQPGQITLADGDLAAISSGVAGELSGRPTWRILIRSYATSTGVGLSSERRIALSRVLALRKALLDQGIEASRIDVQSEGADTNAKESGDRIDLYLFDPAKK